MSVPPEVIARIFHDVAFKNSETRITASTVALSTEYMNLFVREAITRANEVRLREVPPTAIDGIDNVEPNTEELLQNVDQFSDVTLEEEEADSQRREEQISTSSTSSLDTRHLSAIAGVLVLDF